MHPPQWPFSRFATSSSGPTWSTSALDLNPSDYATAMTAWAQLHSAAAEGDAVNGKEYRL